MRNILSMSESAYLTTEAAARLADTTPHMVLKAETTGDLVSLALEAGRGSIIRIYARADVVAWARGRGSSTT